jgi:hypothetical protein
MNFNAHPNLVLPPSYNRVGMLDGLSQAVQWDIPFLIDGWIVEQNVTYLRSIGMILGILKVPQILNKTVLIVPDAQRPDAAIWQGYMEKGIQIFPESTPQKRGMGPEVPISHFDIRRNLLLEAAGQLSRIR